MWDPAFGAVISAWPSPSPGISRFGDPEPSLGRGHMMAMEDPEPSLGLTLAYLLGHLPARAYLGLGILSPAWPWAYDGLRGS